MLVRAEIQRAVQLQICGHRLLPWLEKAFDQGFIAPEAAHAYATMDNAAYAWITGHYQNIPDAARPAQEDLAPFSKLFSTYLLNTFDLETNPGERLYSPGAHCFCPLCSWMVRVPHLRPKKVGAADKMIADRLKRAFIRSLSLEVEAEISEVEVEHMLRDPNLREAIGLCTYASDLLQRLAGIAVGPATLALWRSFAWTSQGSPKKNFALSAEAIMDAQQTLVEHMLGSSRA